MFIGAAPTKAERDALKAQFTRTALDLVQKAALRDAIIAKGHADPRKRKQRRVFFR
jgi:hypothetical protein